MPGDYKKDDLRVIKTHRASTEALLRLLERRNFVRITVNELCKEAQISRATFYAHFEDKYNLLKYCLLRWTPDIRGEGSEYQQIEKNVNKFIQDNSKIIINLLEDANQETLDLIYEFIISLLDIDIGDTKDSKLNSEYIILSNFCSGGILKLLLWQIKNKFPSDLQMINTHSYKILKNILENSFISE